jgi:hypothetical protein
MKLTALNALTQTPIYNYTRQTSRDKFYLKYALRADERVTLVSEVGVHGLVLFEYFLRMASIGTIDLKDDNSAATYFGWSAHTAGRYRRLLTQKGWFHSESSTLPSGRRIHAYYLGKENVQAAKGLSAD